MPRSTAARKPLPNPFNEATRAMQDEELLAAVRAAPGPGRVEPARGQERGSLFDEPTRMGDIDSHLIESTRRPDDITARENAVTGPDAEYPPKFLPANTELSPPLFNDRFDDDEATRMASVDGSLPPKRSRGPSRLPPPSRSPASKNDERTRAVDIRNDPSISDIDWDID
ncbi:MAG: hypothetical protein HOV81_04935 [Kofleriaceae bacterium]|nr:hypothetical protein [Kofleriaceae bacterium]